MFQSLAYLHGPDRAVGDFQHTSALLPPPQIHIAIATTADQIVVPVHRPAGAPRAVCPCAVTNECGAVVYRGMVHREAAVALGAPAHDGGARQDGGRLLRPAPQLARALKGPKLQRPLPRRHEQIVLPARVIGTDECCGLGRRAPRGGADLGRDSVAYMR
jgi:hypothetical protein